MTANRKDPGQAGHSLPGPLIESLGDSTLLLDRGNIPKNDDSILSWRSASRLKLRILFVVTLLIHRLFVEPIADQEPD